MSSMLDDFNMQLEFRLDTISADGSIPTEWIPTIARLLHRPFGGPGYAIIRGSLIDLDLARARIFQASLLRAVWQEMLGGGQISSKSKPFRLKEFEAVDGQLPRNIVGDVITFKRLHFDPFSVTFSHLYEAQQNLSGGAVSLVDVHSYLQDAGCSLEDAFEPLHAPGHFGRLVARHEHRQRMLQGYVHTFEPPPAGDLMLLMVRNDPFVGVAHEIAEVQAIDAALPTLRRFYRASIAPRH